MRKRFLFFAGIWLAAGSSFLQAGIEHLASEIPAHTFHIEVNGDWRPVVGVKRVGRVRVLMDDGNTRLVKPEFVGHIDKPLPPVGRITHFDASGTNYWSTFARLESDKVWFEIEVVADRLIENAYMVLFAYIDNKPEPTIGFAPIGDLPPGELIRHEVQFRNVRVDPDANSKWKFRYYFYSGGLPLETIDIDSVYNLPESRSLLIPWQVRLKAFFDLSEELGISRGPQPFQVGLSAFSIEEAKESGLESIRPRVNVKKNGTIELLTPGAELSQWQSEALESDVAGWLFFPAIEDGLPIDKTVTCPIQF